MDRDKVTKPTAQIGFIKFVLIPMFETVMKVGLLIYAGTHICLWLHHTVMFLHSFSLRLRRSWFNL